MADERKPVLKALPPLPAKWSESEKAALTHWARGFEHVMEPNRTELIKYRFEHGPAPAADSVVKA